VVGFKKLDRDGNEVEEQTPIHIKDIEKMTHDSNHSDSIFDSLGKEIEEEAETAKTENDDDFKIHKNTTLKYLQQTKLKIDLKTKL
jgi:vancomycin resistance protein YoaR